LNSTGLALSSQTFNAAEGFALQIPVQAKSWIALVALIVIRSGIWPCANAAHLHGPFVAFVGNACEVTGQSEAPVAGDALMIRSPILQQQAFCTCTAQALVTGVWLASTVHQFVAWIAL